MKLLRGWRGRLASTIEDHRRRPHKYGESDCALFAAGCIQAMTGEDLGGIYRGKYSSHLEGVRLVRADGYSDHVEFFSSRMEEVPPSRARYGDLVTVSSEEGPAFGIVIGGQIAVYTLIGIGNVPLASATRAFRVI